MLSINLATGEFGEGLPIDQDRGSWRLPIGLRLQSRLSIVSSRTAMVRAFRTQWVLAVRRKEWLSLGGRNGQGFRLILPPRDRFYADPFIIEHRGRSYIFFEDFRYALGKAVISCMQIDFSGRVSRPLTVLDGPDHLSYPFVFNLDGDVYMIPETSARGRVELYRAVEFPNEWQLERVLIEQPASDATLWEQDGTFWLFANLSARMRRLPCEDLHIFFADSLDGAWIPHPMNPVVADVAGARPGGRLFLDEGRLIRPAQDCSSGYGSGLVLKHVTSLTRRDYQEEVLTTLSPGIAGSIGTHHLDHDRHFEVMDVTVRRLRTLRALIRASRRKMKDRIAGNMTTH
jgi:hypothetical protein